MKTKQNKVGDVAGDLEDQANPGVVALPATVEETEHQKKILTLGREIIEQTVKTGEKYFQLCEYIRKNEVGPREVSASLTELGFHRVTVSKINKVANASDELFSEFAAKTIGFNKVLELARGEVVGSLAKSMGTTVVEIKAEVKEREHAEHGLSYDDEKPEDLDGKKEASMARAAGVLARGAVHFGFRSRTYKPGNGYIILISREKAVKPNKKNKLNL